MNDSSLARNFVFHWSVFEKKKTVSYVFVLPCPPNDLSFSVFLSLSLPFASFYDNNVVDLEWHLLM